MTPEQHQKLQGHVSEIAKLLYAGAQAKGMPMGILSEIRGQITGARWKPERVPQILALRCAYLSGRLDLFSPLKVCRTPVTPVPKTAYSD